MIINLSVYCLFFLTVFVSLFESGVVKTILVLNLSGSGLRWPLARLTINLTIHSLLFKDIGLTKSS